MFGIKVYAMEVGNLMTIVCCGLLIVPGFVCLHKPWFSVSLVQYVSRALLQCFSKSPTFVSLHEPGFNVMCYAGIRQDMLAAVSSSSSSSSGSSPNRNSPEASWSQSLKLQAVNTLLFYNLNTQMVVLGSKIPYL